MIRDAANSFSLLSLVGLCDGKAYDAAWQCAVCWDARVSCVDAYGHAGPAVAVALSVASCRIS
jgi:hypothetical protein